MDMGTVWAEWSGQFLDAVEITVQWDVACAQTNQDTGDTSWKGSCQSDERAVEDSRIYGAEMSMTWGLMPQMRPANLQALAVLFLEG